MTTTRKFSIALDALVELKQDVAAPQPQLTPVAPTLSRVLSDIGSLPREALFLGVALDGLPVLLNLHDATPGPLLVVGDAEAGKTAFLHTLAQGVQQTHAAESVQFGVITNHPEEWDQIGLTSHCVGIFSASQVGASDFIRSLATWAHANGKSSQVIVLLIDDLEAVAKLEPEVVQALRWLLLRGPARKIWPVITMNAERYGQTLAWIPMFRTRIFGRIANEKTAEALGGDKPSALNQRVAGMQFSLRENGKWLKFWLPSC